MTSQMDSWSALEGGTKEVPLLRLPELTLTEALGKGAESLRWEARLFPPWTTFPFTIHLHQSITTLRDAGEWHGCVNTWYSIHQWGDSQASCLCSSGINNLVT